MARRTKSNQRNEDIKKDFKHLTDVKKIRTNYAVQQLAEKYYLNDQTIEFIVYGIGRYKAKPVPQVGEQLSFF